MSRHTPLKALIFGFWGTAAVSVLHLFDNHPSSNESPTISISSRGEFWLTWLTVTFFTVLTCQVHSFIFNPDSKFPRMLECVTGLTGIENFCYGSACNHEKKETFIFDPIALCKYDSPIFDSDSRIFGIALNL